MSKRPVVLVVMDGVGIRESDFGNAVSNAYKPTLDELWKNCPHTEIKAHGVAVGLPSDGDMGTVKSATTHWAAARFTARVQNW